MNIFQHIYSAVRYGEWKCGWEQYAGKPQFGIYHDYYECINMSCFHLYKLWIGVEY